MNREIVQPLFDTLFSGHPLIGGFPFVPEWNEHGTDAKPLELTAAMLLGVPDDADGDTAATSRVPPQTYLRSNPLNDPMVVPELLSPDGSIYLSTLDGNLVARATTDGRIVQLTTDGSAEHEWRFDWSHPGMAMLGMAADVTNFSADGTLLAAYRVDFRGVAQSTQTDYGEGGEQIVHRYAARPGAALERTTLHVLDLRSKTTVDLDLGDTTDMYPVFAGWLPDTDEVLVVVLSRDCRRADVLAANVTTGASRTLFTEVGESFVRIQHHIYYGRKPGLTLTPDRRSILWESERSGWKHVYLYDLDGTLVRPLTEGEFPVDAVTGCADSWVYLTARTDQTRPYDVHICRVPLDGGPLEVLTAGVPGVHSARLSPTGKALIDTCSSVTSPPVAVLRQPDGTVVREVCRADTSGLDALQLPPVEEFVVKAADGVTDLWGLLYRPRGFDPEQTYPVIEYVYGGPQLQLVGHDFPFAGPFGSMMTALTELGACVVQLDARGTPGRSKAFHDTVYRNWAGHLADDHAEAIKQLVESRPHLDLTRVGVTGGSWGGYAATRLLADRPDVYRAAVASVPSYDPHGSLLFECYLGLLDEPGGREVYDAASTLERAMAITRPLMFAGGTYDHHTWQDVIKMSERLIQAEIEHDLVVLPGQFHVYGPTHSRYYHRRLTSFFAAYLGTRPTSALLP